jgi:hemoglobin
MDMQSLYARLGGYDALAAVVDDFLQRLRSDPHVGVYWKGRNNDTKKRDRQLLVDSLCQVAGGPVVYTGGDMQTAHAGLGISDSDWQVTVGHLSATLEELHVPEPEKQEVLTFVSSLKRDIVETAEATLATSLSGPNSTLTLLATWLSDRNCDCTEVDANLTTQNQ